MKNLFYLTHLLVIRTSISIFNPEDNKSIVDIPLKNITAFLLLMQIRGNLDGAMALCKEQERICGEMRNIKGLHHSLGTQKVVLYSRGGSDRVMTLSNGKNTSANRETGLLVSSLINQVFILDLEHKN